MEFEDGEAKIEDSELRTEKENFYTRIDWVVEQSLT